MLHGNHPADNQMAAEKKSQVAPQSGSSQKTKRSTSVVVTQALFDKHPH
jgi:hypothetical protein